MRTAVIVSLVILASCKSAPQHKAEVESPLVETIALPPVSLVSEGVCGDANWTAAMACEDSSCVRAAAGDSCVECVAAASACIDQRSSGCAELCNSCLGEDRCQQLDNVAVAATHLEASPDRAYSGGAAIAHRIGALPVSYLLAVTPDNLRMVRFDREDPGWNRSREVTFALVDPDENVLRTVGSECHMVTSPAGTWLVENCEDTARLYELRTGFLRAEFQLHDRSGPVRNSFGGEQFLVIRGPEKQWRLHDLLHQTSVPINGIYEHEDVHRIAISPDGTMVATNSWAKVWPIDAPDRLLLDNKDIFSEEVFWMSPDTLVCEVKDGATRVVSFPSGHVREVPGPAESDVGRVFWTSHRAGDEVVFVGASDKGPIVQTEDGLQHRIPIIEGGYRTDQVLRAEASNWRKGFGVSPDGGLVLGSAFGLLDWSTDTGLANTELLRGELLWHSPGESDDEIIVGLSSGAAVLNLSTGERTPVPMPIDYRLIDVRYQNGKYIGLGSKPTAEETERRHTISIVEASGESYIVTHDEKPVVAGLDVDGRLHVIDRTGLKSYEPGREPKRYAATKQPGGSTVMTRGGPPRALPTQGLLTSDGAFALFPQQGKATLIRTRDHKVVRSWPAMSCALAERTPVVACMESRGSGGEVEIITFDANTGKELASSTARVRNMELVNVSDDGERVMIGSSLFQTASSVLDLERGRFHDLPRAAGKLVGFHADGRVMFVGPTHVELFATLPPAKL